MNISVAIDGPAGSGKSTVAKILASKLNLMYIDTGAMYRAVTYKALEKKIISDEIDCLCKMVAALDIHFDNDKIIVDTEDISDKIRMPEISKNVSYYAAIPEVRKLLAGIQKSLSEKYNVVMDGRDIGTVVLKDAPYKFFLMAAPEERANRRYKELTLSGINVKYEEVLNDILKRDYIDSHREASPLKQADDAVLIDSSSLTIDEVVQVMLDHIRKEL